MFDFLRDKIISIHGFKIDLLSVIFAVSVIVAFYLLVFITNLFLKREVLSKLKLDRGIQDAVTKINKIVLLAIGFYIAFQVLGINLSALTVFAGVVGLGLSFGMQNIISNFISGIIIIFERPIKIGDYVEIGGLEGIVGEIRTRSTTITTRDNIQVIVPNSNFITQNVVNWSHNNPKIRVRMPIGIEYAPSKIDLAIEILKDIAGNNDKVLKKPKPIVWFTSFGDFTYNLELIIWLSTPINRHVVLTEINIEIAKKFDKHKIDIPFPIRNLIFKNNLDISKTDQKN